MKFGNYLSKTESLKDFSVEENKHLNRGVQLLVLLAFIVVLALAGILLPDREYSPGENRSLAKRPEFSVSGLVDGSYTKGLENYYADQFALRDRWVQISSMTDRLRGKKERGGVYFGKDGYLLPTPTEADWDKLKLTADGISGFGERFNADIYMMLVPDAASVMPEKLPFGAPVKSQTEDISKFMLMLSDKVKTVDAGAILMEHKEEEIYYRTDHHWTSLGAKYVFDKLAPAMDISVSKEYEPLLVADDFVGTLGSKAGSYSKKDDIYIYAPKEDGQNDIVYYVNYTKEGERRTSIFDSGALEEKNKYEVFLGGNYGRIEIKTSADSDRNLLILKDSYANAMVQFLYPYFGSIIIVDPRYSFDNLDTLMSTQGITDVLILYSADILFADTALADYLGAES